MIIHFINIPFYIIKIHNYFMGMLEFIIRFITKFRNLSPKKSITTIPKYFPFTLFSSKYDDIS